MKSAILIIAEKNFRDEEYQVPKNILEKAHIKVITVSTTLNEVTGKLGLKVIPDQLLSKTYLDQHDALIFIGGGGAEQYFHDIYAHELARDAKNKGKVLGAICIAPVILANAGILKNKHATVFPSEYKTIELAGAISSNESVVVDGKIITANGPDAAKEFGEQIVKLLTEY